MEGEALHKKPTQPRFRQEKGEQLPNNAVPLRGRGAHALQLLPTLRRALGLRTEEALGYLGELLERASTYAGMGK
jgi:hypothetical protein